MTPDKLYAATNDGLDIIALHFPDAARKPQEKFRYREGERTPSAALKLMTTKAGVKVWKVTDFGGDGRAMDPIQIHMEKQGIGFSEAMLDLAAKFSVPDEISRSINRPDVRKSPATADQPDGYCSWDIDQDFSEDECSLMSPRANADTLKSLNWYRVNSITTVRNREATTKYSNEHYPIFMRECWFQRPDGSEDRFYKIYEPLNADKGWRFQYQPKGKKPKDYINGLRELNAAWTKLNEADRRDWESNPDNEGKPYREKKLPEVIICSGERDAVCVRALGYHPVWFNSETYQVTEEDMGKLRRLAETIYNIPDIDETGKLKGTELALKYVDISTIWLPEKLSERRDNRGRPMKDFRDWCGLHKSKGEFKDLLEVACPAKFWTAQRVKETKEYKYNIDYVCLHEFLRLNGFYILRDKNRPNAVFIRIVGNVVKLVNPREIRAFVREWAKETAQPKGLRNLIFSTAALSPASLEAMEDVDLDFTSYTDRSQYLYFPRFAIEVTGEGFRTVDYRGVSSSHHVWDEDVVAHDIKILPDFFEIAYPEGSAKSEDFDISIKSDASNYMRYLINSSRIYWRKELEEYADTLGEKEGEEYRRVNKFNIAGPALTEEEVHEQKQCLISKIFIIGYMLHRYKSESRPWAPFLMDNIVGENDQCNGRSGKSFMLGALSKVVNMLTLSARNSKILDNQFLFEQVSKRTAIVVMDDCNEYFPFKDFYSNLTNGITINAKNVSAYNLQYEDSPKFAFNTNYVPKDFDASSVGRMIFSVFSDYYHQVAPDNDYRENRSIFDDFGKNLLGSQYTEAEWEADINFFMQCLRFYLSVCDKPIKIVPKIDNIIYRRYMREMTDSFRDWAEVYFDFDPLTGEGERLNTMVPRLDAFEDYKRKTGSTKVTSQKFKKMLEAFCHTSDFVEELNPEDLHTSGGRILKDVWDEEKGKKVKAEMIYIRTKGGVDRDAQKAEAQKAIDDIFANMPERGGEEDPF